MLQMYHPQSFGLSTPMAGWEVLERQKDLPCKEFPRDFSHLGANCFSMRNPSEPDFKHRLIKEPLWMHSRENPTWVKDELFTSGRGGERCLAIPSTADKSLPSLLWTCSKHKDLSRGTQLHYELWKRGLDEKQYADVLITMYANCGDPQKAQALLDIHSSSSSIAWNALLASYVRDGQNHIALDFFDRMQHEKIPPNAETYARVLKACAVVKAIDKGKQVHDEITRCGLLEYDVVLGGALVDMYAKCGALSQARIVLKELPSCDVVSWNALISGYARKGQVHEALKCFERMEQEGIHPNPVTLVCILKACAVAGAIDEGKQIHDEILTRGLLEHDIVLGGALVDMYAKCGDLARAQSVLQKLPFRNVVSWTALISGYVQKEQGENALDCYNQMKLEGLIPNAVTYVCILKACAMIGNIEKGKLIHNEISRQGLLEKNILLGGALVDMYAKCGTLPQAQKVLKRLPFRDVVSWSALISGYAQNGQGQNALKCFEKMQLEGIRPNAVTFVSILKACGVLGTIEKGKQIHKEISRQGLLEHCVELGGALVDMYAKCGDLAQAQIVLEKLPSRNVISWNTLIAGYAQEGQGEQALKCFEQMQCEGILPDMVTFSCLLNLCNHLGLVEKGQELFDLIETTDGLKPDVECFSCMVDLLGRAGHLVKAVELIQKMPFPATSAMWLCLLSACREWVDATVGAWAFEQAVELDTCHEAAYILMADIYVATGMTEKAKDIEARMKAGKI